VKEPLDLARNLRHRCVQRLAPWIDDNGPLRIQPIELRPDRFPYTPPDAVPHHSFSNCPRNGEANTRPFNIHIPHVECREKWTGKSFAGVIDPSKVRGFKEADTFGETRDGVLPLGADGQLFASASPAAREHGPSVFGSHAGEESMRLGTLAVIRLKSAFRHCSSSI
jgi:hypothetical protein